MSQQDTQLYNQLTGQLSPEEQQVIKAAIEQADKLEREQAVIQAAGNGGGDAAGVLPQTNGAS